MKKIILAFGVLVSSFVCAQKAPAVNKTEFSSQVLQQKIVSSEGKKVTIAEVLEEHKGKILLLDFWASWCRDCILALPKTKELLEQNPNVEFVYFSLDRSMEQWKKGLEKYDIASKENYWFDEGWKNSFNDYIDLNWVPRFLLVDQSGKIAHYYAISPTDENLVSTIQKISQ